MSEPKRILHILQRMEAGGTQALLMNIYRKIDRSKIQFDFMVVYTEKQFYDDEILNMGGKLYRTSFREDLNLFKFCKYLNDFFKKHHKEYDVVHVHAYTIGYFCLKYASKWNVPIRIAHSHNNAMSNDYTRFFKYPMKKLFTLKANYLFACSQEAGKFLFGDKKFYVLHNSIDSKKFSFDPQKRNKFRIDNNIDNCFVVGHVGRFHIQKNHKFLIEIFEQILYVKPNSLLILVGTGPLEEEIKNMVVNKKLDKNVLFLGNRKDMEVVFQAFDVFVLPSVFEGLGIVAIEAQASGIPSVCSDGLPEIANVSPLFHRVSLKDNAETWAKTCVSASMNKLAHTNMSNYIINSGFDINNTSKQIEKFYLDRINELKGDDL